MSDVLAAPGREPTAIDAAMRTLFTTIARVRGDRALHPLGRTHEAMLEVFADRSRLPSVAVLQDPGPTRVLVRISRGAGLPTPMPDALGIAIRWPDRYGPGMHQDLLLTTSSDLPLLNHLPLPRVGMSGAQFSSLLPYEVAGRRLLFGARIATAPRDVASMRASWSGLRIELMLGTRFGRFHPIGEIAIGDPLPPRLDAELRFDPWNTAPDVRPAGWWNRVRAAAYDGSRRGSGTAQVP